ncbi:uncharacterized protein LOC133532826 [Cydia pomonella]|uniref:uncharacterized protein LOC133532826 n=1 Tax=Cydia pomonella TaxID=82600 RepID=UPI002ADE174A|nr:uncharacterized protein LOC133532826 [Cydia pomonella]
MPFIYSNTQTPSTMPFKYSDTQTRSTMPFIYSDSETRSTMPFIYSDPQTRSTMPFIYSDSQTRSTMPFIYSDTRTSSTMLFVYSNTLPRSTIPFIYSDTQTRSTVPFTSPDKTITKSNVNKKTYSVTERNIIRNMPIQKGNDPFINVYNYMQNHHVTSPDGKDAKRLKRPLKYNLKPRPLDGTHHSIINKDLKYFDYGTSETPVKRIHATQKSKSGFMKDEIERFSRSTNRPGLDSHFDVTKSLKSRIERFKIPLQKLASIKANFYNGEDNPFKKEIELVNNEGNIFNEPYTTSSDKLNENERFKNAVLFRSNVGHDSSKIERLENTDVTQTEWYPWIKTGAAIHNRASYMAHLPEIQTTASPIYPWILTKMFTVSTTERYQKLTSKPTFMYEYKELNPEKALRMRPETEERLNSDRQETTQKIQITPRVEPDLEYSQTTGLQEVESEPFSMFLAKLMKILASKTLKDLKGLISPFERAITTLLDSGKLIKLGMTTGSFIAQMTTSLIAPMKEIQRHIFIMQISLENRQRMLDDTFNAMLDELDNVYDVSEEEAMQRILHEAMVYPNTSKTGEQIVQGFLEDVFLHPMNRIAGTAHGNVVFENIAKVANKYNTPIEPIARRYENQYQITKYNKFRNANTQIINQGLTNGDLRKYAKHRTKEHLSGRKSNSGEMGKPKTKDEDRQTVKSNVDSKGTNESKTIVSLKCKYLENSCKIVIAPDLVYNRVYKAQSQSSLHTTDLNFTLNLLSKMAALKTLLILVVLAIVMAAAVADHVQPCDLVCDRPSDQQNECCRAHGYSGGSCNGGNTIDCY